MIGSGLNIKSLAYIGNFSIFLKKCILSGHNNLLFNYVDKPDMTVNELIEFVKLTLDQKTNVGIRIPYIIGMLIGFCADVASVFSRKKFKISRVRIKKFCSSTSFSSKKENLKGFEAPYTLKDGIRATLINEFINPKDGQEVFDTE